MTAAIQRLGNPIDRLGDLGKALGNGILDGTVLVVHDGHHLEGGHAVNMHGSGISALGFQLIVIVSHVSFSSAVQ